MLLGNPHMLDSRFYVYRHIRKDLNKPFYIGVGTVGKNGICNRAYSTNRNVVWHRVNNLTNVEVQIIYETNDYQEALKKEIEFISLYGRINLNKGILVNLTDGGEGNLNWKVSDETRAKFRARQLGSKRSIESLKKLSESLLKHYEHNPSKVAKKVYQYDVNGVFIKEWTSAMTASLGINESHSSVNKAIRQRNGRYKGYYFSLKYEGEKIELDNSKRIGICGVQKLDYDGNILGKYKNIPEAAKSLFLKNKKSGINQISSCCKGRSDCFMGYKWRYSND